MCTEKIGMKDIKKVLITILKAERVQYRAGLRHTKLLEKKVEYLSKDRYLSNREDSGIQPAQTLHQTLELFSGLREFKCNLTQFVRLSCVILGSVYRLNTQ